MWNCEGSGWLAVISPVPVRPKPAANSECPPVQILVTPESFRSHCAHDFQFILIQDCRVAATTGSLSFLRRARRGSFGRPLIKVNSSNTNSSLKFRDGHYWLLLSSGARDLQAPGNSESIPKVRISTFPSRIHSLGRFETFQPPPNALIRSTVASMRRRWISVSFRSFVRAAVCEVTTWR